MSQLLTEHKPQETPFRVRVYLFRTEHANLARLFVNKRVFSYLYEDSSVGIFSEQKKKHECKRLFVFIQVFEGIIKYNNEQTFQTNFKIIIPKQNQDNKSYTKFNVKNIKTNIARQKKQQLVETRFRIEKKSNISEIVAPKLT